MSAHNLTEAEQAKQAAKGDSTTFLRIAELARADFDQDWENETTFVMFSDESRASVCGNTITVFED